MQERSNNKKLPIAVIVLGLVSFLTDAATEMLYPLIPVFVSYLGSGAIVLGVIEGVAETTASMLKLIVGIMSDKIKKRKFFVLLGYSISSIARPFTAVVTAGWHVVIVRMIDRIGKGIRSSPRDALIASATDPSIRGKAYGFHRAMDHSGAVVGPLLAIFTLIILTSYFDITEPLSLLRWVFACSIIPGILAVIMIKYFVKEAQSPPQVSKTFKLSLKQFDRNFIIYLLILILFSLGNSSDAFLLFRVEESVSKSGLGLMIIDSFGPLRDLISKFGTTEQQSKIVGILILPLIWSYFHIIKAVFSTPFGALSDRIGRKIVIVIGWGIYALIYICFAFIDMLSVNLQLPAIFILFGIYALFYAFTEGAEKAFVADMVSENLRGSAFGMYNFSIGLAALPASLIFGVIYSFTGATYAFMFGAGLAFVSMILLSVFVKGKKQIS